MFRAIQTGLFEPLAADHPQAQQPDAHEKHGGRLRYRGGHQLVLVPVNHRYQKTTAIKRSYRTQ
jgi:hypothetical protein